MAGIPGSLWVSCIRCMFSKLRKRRASRSSESLAAWAGLLYSPCLAALYCFRSMAAFMPRLMAFACFCFVQLFSSFGGNAGASGRNRPLAKDMRSVCTHVSLAIGDRVQIYSLVMLVVCPSRSSEWRLTHHQYQCTYMQYIVRYRPIQTYTTMKGYERISRALGDPLTNQRQSRWDSPNIPGCFQQW